MLTRTLLGLSLITAAHGCADSPDTASHRSPGMLNGMLNGFHHPEGLTAYLAEECPLLGERLLAWGELAAPFEGEIVAELAKPECDHFLFYTVQLMVPYGETVALYAAGHQVAEYDGAMGLSAVVAQAYPQYDFVQHGFHPAYPIARKVVTQGYAALTNGVSRRVSFKTNVPELDAHRRSGEDAWPREFLQLVPFTPQAIAAMTTNPAFLARVPDFFNSCYPEQTNYDYLTHKLPCAEADAAFTGCKSTGGPPPPQGYCPVPVVVHGNVDFVDDVVPGRSCRILRPGELPPAGSAVYGDVIVPEGGCPLIYYGGRNPNQLIYDDRALNAAELTDDGCDVTGPSAMTDCDFDVIAEGLPLPDDFLAYYVFNVAPVAP